MPVLFRTRAPGVFLKPGPPPTPRLTAGSTATAGSNRVSLGESLAHGTLHMLTTGAGGRHRPTRIQCLGGDMRRTATVNRTRRGVLLAPALALALMWACKRQEA